jgi:hypothetical protein
VVGALRRAHAHPNRLVHPHLLAVAYLQSGVSANCRPGDVCVAIQGMDHAGKIAELFAFLVGGLTQPQRTNL